MKRVVSIGLAALIAIAFLAAPASAGKVKHPSELKFHDLDLTTPQYEELEFENGMTGFFIEDHEVPVVSIQMILSTSRAPKEKGGLGELATWTIRNGGSAEWPGDRINQELEFVAASIESRSQGRSANVYVDCLKKDLGLCLEILGEILVRPAFPEDKIELRRETMLENIRRENDEPRRVAYREFRRILYGEHPKAWHQTEETVGSLTRDDLVAYHEAYFRPNNAIIAVSGDLTREELVEALDGAFAEWEPGPVEIEPEPEMVVEYVPSIHYAYKDMNQAMIIIGHLGMNSRDENRVAVQLMNFILGGGSFTSRITQKVRTDEGLAYAAYSQYGADPWTLGAFAASSQTRSDASGRAIQLIVDLIREMRDDGPTEDEVERAKDTYINNHAFEYESKQGVVQRLARLRWEGRPLDTPQRDFEMLADLSREDIMQAAAEYLHPDGLKILVVGDQSTFDQPLSNFGDVVSIELE